MPPSVAPAATRGGSNGRTWLFSASKASTVATGVPERAVHVYSSGSYSITPDRSVIVRLPEVDSAGLLPPPTGRTLSL